MDIDIVHGGRGWDVMGVSGDADDEKKSDRTHPHTTNGVWCSPLTRSWCHHEGMYVRPSMESHPWMPGSGLTISLQPALMTETVGWSVVQNERGESTWGSRARHWVHVPSLHKVYGSCGRQSSWLSTSKMSFGRIRSKTLEELWTSIPMAVDVKTELWTSMKTRGRKWTRGHPERLVQSIHNVS
jgi:hypothetical protein